MKICQKQGVMVLISALAMAFCLSQPAQAQLRVGLKFYGGYGYLLGGEGNDGSKGYLDFWAAQAHVYGGYLASGEYKPFHYGLDAGGDLIIYFTPNIGLGFGGGYLQSSSSSTIDLTQPGGSASISTKPQVSAIPIRASLYISLPMGTSANLVLQGGAGYYLAKYEDIFRIEEGPDWVQYDYKADGKGIGFHGGLGFELNIGPNIGLFLEGLARYAVIGGFEGTFDESIISGTVLSESGKLYFFKESDPALGTFSIILVNDTAPSGAGISDVHEAKIDFSGFAARAGFVFRF
jgi:hypothetical protein